MYSDSPWKLGSVPPTMVINRPQATCLSVRVPLMVRGCRQGLWGERGWGVSRARAQKPADCCPGVRGHSIPLGGAKQTRVGVRSLLRAGSDSYMWCAMPWTGADRATRLILVLRLICGLVLRKLLLISWSVCFLVSTASENSEESSWLRQVSGSQLYWIMTLAFFSRSFLNASGLATNK